MKPALTTLKRALQVDDINEEFLADACWALYRLCDGSEETIQNFIDVGLVPRLLQLLQNPSPSVIESALFTVKIIANGNNQQTQFVIDCGALPRLANLLTDQNNQIDYANTIKKEACGTISYITAGTEEQIQAVIDENLIPKLVNLAQNAEFDVKKVAALAISNACVRGSRDQIKYMVDQSCIQPLCDLLVGSGPEMVSVCLDGLNNISKVGEAEKNNSRDVNDHGQLIDDAGWVKKIENLQFDDNYKIVRAASEILGTHWLEEVKKIDDYDEIYITLTF